MGNCALPTANNACNNKIQINFFMALNRVCNGLKTKKRIFYVKKKQPKRPRDEKDSSTLLAADFKIIGPR